MEIYARSLPVTPDDDGPDDGFEDRQVRIETTLGGAGVVTGDLTPECAAVITAVLDALSAPADAEDPRTHGQRYHDALQEAMKRLLASGLLPERAGQPVKGLGPCLPGRAARHGRRIGPGERVDHRDPASGGPPTAPPPPRAQATVPPGSTATPPRPPPATRPSPPSSPATSKSASWMTWSGSACDWSTARPRCQPARRRDPGRREAAGLTVSRERCSKPLSARPPTSSPVPAAWPASCAPASSAPGWPARACPWTSASPRRSRPASATPSSCATGAAAGPAAATSPRRPVRSTTSSTRPTAAPPASKTACFSAYHHQIVIHRWGWTLVLNPDGTTTAWNPDRTKVLRSHGPPARAG